MDLTRFTQNMHVTGWVEVDGKRVQYREGLGTRDRSWGIRSIGALDPQPVVPISLPQFYWLWTPTNFPNLSLFAHVNEDEAGAAWNNRAALAMDGAEQGKVIHLSNQKFSIDWLAGTRHARAIQLDVRDPSGRDHVVTWQPIAQFQMKGIGYGHPEWTHGGWKGDLVVAREDFRPDALNPLELPNLHVQTLCVARHEGGGATSDGIGLVEQLVIGPHRPSGFAGLVDGAGD